MASETGPAELAIGVAAVDGSMSSAVSGILEACAIANAQALASGRSLRAVVVSERGGAISAAAGVQIPATLPFDAAGALDAVVLPPVFGNPEDLIDANPSLVEWTRAESRRGATVGAACTGTFVLAETGALDGRRATTTPAFRPLFEERFPKVQLRPALRLVDEGPVLTAGATTAYLDLVLAVVGRFLGPRIAINTARALSIDPNPRSQHPFLLPRTAVPHNDESVRAVEEWIGRHLGESLEPEALAKRAALSPRSLSRRFRAATGESVTEFVQRRRVEAAMDDLESTRMSFEEITHRLGYEDARSFRRLFARLTGVSPREYRKRFGFAERSPES